MTKHTADKAFRKPETVMREDRLPSMAGVFLKAMLIAPFRSNTIQDPVPFTGNRIILENHTPEPCRVRQYCDVCGFDGQSSDTLPMPYIQTLFIGLLGRFITSSYFPFTPLGLIQIYQSFELKQHIRFGDSLDLSCTLERITKTDKGFETDFLLQASVSGEVAWQGISRYLSRTPGEKKKKEKKQNAPLEKKEIIPVPAGTGLRYARVSGDFNPHHLYPMLAKLFGFKTAIAHGMFSLARVMASLNRAFDIAEGTRVEARFKLPVFMPAVTALGYEAVSDENGRRTIRFELRDDKEGLPHLSGHLIFDT